HPPPARTDASKNSVGRGARHFGDLLGILAGFAFATEQRYVVTGRQSGGVAEIDSSEIHRDGAQDGTEFAIGDDLAAVREPVENAIGVARSQYADAHSARGAERTAISHQRALWNLFYRQKFGLPGK